MYQLSYKWSQEFNIFALNIWRQETFGNLDWQRTQWYILERASEYAKIM